eukprot:SAG31_NODE_1232_length_9211_cov_31.167581_3_plen_116_part_00
MLAKQACDVRMLAQAFEWAGTSGLDSASNTAFNITNGDTMVWTAVYPAIAELFGIAQADAPEPIRLAVEMPQYAAVWDQIVAKHGLRPLSLDTIVGGSWEFTDNSMGGWGVVSSR